MAIQVEMPVWIVVISDRHSDVEVLPFSDEGVAIRAARDQVNLNARHPELIEWDEPLTEGMIASGWIFNVRYGVEGDSVRVVKRIMDAGKLSMASPMAEAAEAARIAEIQERARKLRLAVKEYERLSAFAELRAQSPLVPGAGYLKAPVMLIGEAPGEEEVKQGFPFVGPSGELLNTLLSEIKIARQLCYVTNVVLWRPPGNRTPHRYEIASSRTRLFLEIEIIRPAVIITLGATARQAMRPSGPPVSVCHGLAETTGDVLKEVETIGGRAIINLPHFVMLPTYHPSAGLRDPAILKVMRKDLRRFFPWKERHD